MRVTNEKVYRCDFCNKAMVSAGVMGRHERMCKKNPNNKHKCFQYCKHLLREEIEIKNKFEEDKFFDISRGACTFRCKITGIEMHSYKLERYKMNASRCKKLIRMPLECESYDILEGHSDFNNA